MACIYAYRRAYRLMIRLYDVICTAAYWPFIMKKLVALHLLSFLALLSLVAFNYLLYKKSKLIFISIVSYTSYYLQGFDFVVDKDLFRTGDANVAPFKISPFLTHSPFLTQIGAASLSSI